MPMGPAPGLAGCPGTLLHIVLCAVTAVGCGEASEHPPTQLVSPSFA